MPITTKGVAAIDSKTDLVNHTYDLPALRELDVHVDVKFCGVCHTDYHELKAEWGPAGVFPMVAGHEIVGIVKEVGAKVTKFKAGDKVGVGYQCNGCGTCQNCNQKMEPYCDKIVPVFGRKDHDGGIKYGGFGKDVIVTERYVSKYPENLDMAAGAPLLCAGITVYSPMKHWKMDKVGARIGVVGMGGLGHMAVKFAKAFGAVPVVISRTEDKRKTAMELGAAEFVVTSDPACVEKTNGTLDFIIDTASGKRDINMYLQLLRVDGVHVMVGLPPVDQHLELAPFPMIFKRRSLAGSLVGGPDEMQEMLNFCGEKNIVCSVEVVEAKYINEAFARMLRGDVRYRFVLDMGKF